MNSAVLTTRAANQYSLLGASAVPSSWIVLWELPFWLVLGYGAMVPASTVSRQEWFGVPMKGTELCIFLSALYYGVAAIAQKLISVKGKGPGILLPATLLLFGYGFVRLQLGPLETEDKLGMSFALMLAASGPIQAAGLLYSYDRDQVRGFLNRLALFLAFVGLVYSAESILGLGLRSEGSAMSNIDFGIERVRGPLFGSSTGYMLLLPAIGWALQSFFDKKLKLGVAAFMTMSLLTSYLGLGSRAALILLGAYVAGLLIWLRNMKRSESPILIAAAFCAAIGFLIFAQADTQRLTKFEDVHRKLTHETAWTIAESEPGWMLALGQGYGSIWAWYRRDSLRGEMIAGGDNLISTGFGTSLYHAHSTFLELLVEFGVAGILWIILVTRQLVRLPRLAGADTPWRLFSLTLVVSLLAFGFDLFIFKEVRVNCVWWMFVMAAMRLAADRERRLA
jgi:hypothetical protein